MSASMQHLVWEHYPQGGTKLLVMLALADWAADDGTVYPPVKELARAIRTSVGNAQKIMTDLMKEGAIEQTGMAICSSMEAKREYRIVLEKLGG